MVLRYKIRTNRIENPQNGGHHSATSLPNRFFRQKEGVNRMVLRYKIRTNRIENHQNGGHHSATSLPCPSMGVPPPPPPPPWAATSLPTIHPGQLSNFTLSTSGVGGHLRCHDYRSRYI